MVFFVPLKAAFDDPYKGPQLPAFRGFTLRASCRYPGTPDGTER